MVRFVVAFLGGLLTIVSPCILPVLPFVFTRAGQPFARGTLPMLAGMVVAFAGVAMLVAVGGNWAIQANIFGRWAAVILLAIFGLTLLVPSLADLMTRPLVAAGERLSSVGQADAPSPLTSAVLGIATGLLWTPCTGPILGLVFTGAALNGANSDTALLLLAYASGAATSLALALLVGGRVYAAMKRSLHTGEWLRRGLGAAVIGGAVAIGFGLDTGILARLSLPGTTAFEQAAIDAFGLNGKSRMGKDKVAENANMSGRLPVEGEFPSLSGADGWLNSPPLTAEQLRGKVVLIDFWTYSCINCIRTIPYIRAWAEKYRDQGLRVIGVHAPEFAFEKNVANVRRAIDSFGITFPVAIDNGLNIWRAFDNNYWPALYVIDATGHIRHHQFGEGGYDTTEKAIQELLTEAGSKAVSSTVVAPDATGIQAAPDLASIASPETYLGYNNEENLVSADGLSRDAAKQYSAGELHLNEWSLSGNWTIEAERAVLNKPDGGITFRFSARDLHLVIGPDAEQKSIRFQVTIDGKPPGDDHGADTDAQGNGIVDGHRLYQLVRQSHAPRQRTFEVRFLDPGVQAYVFTFG